MVQQPFFVIAVSDLARSSAFCRDVPGFEVREFAPGWMGYVNGACRTLAGECPDAIPAGGGVPW